MKTDIYIIFYKSSIKLGLIFVLALKWCGVNREIQYRKFLLVARLTQQRMKERGIMIIRVKSLVVLLVARLTRQRMKKRGMMDVLV